MREQILEYDQALHEVLLHAMELGKRPLEANRISLLESLGRVLAEPIVADRDQPPFSRSTRDGFAVRSSDIAAQRPLRILGQVRAGEMWRGDPVGEGQAFEIMTGAPLPSGADAVVMVEHTEIGSDSLLRVLGGRTLKAGENIVPRGAEARQGTEVISSGIRIAAPEVALAANCGYASLKVYRKPRVAVIATGDELVDLETPPEPWQIRNSNSHALAAMICEEGGEPQQLEIARDSMDDLRSRLEQARNFDLVLLSGGVSMGKYDLVEQALQEAGAEFLFTGAWIQPGKPVVFGRLWRAQDQQWLYFFGLPGNPVSTEVCFRLFVAPMLRALAGRTRIAPQFVEATLAQDVKGGTRVTRFLPAALDTDWQHVSVRIVPWQGSGDLAANARADCFVVLPSGVDQFHAGESVRVLLR